MTGRGGDGSTGPNVLAERWYAQPDDEIGGWCVMNRDHPPSQLNRNADPDARQVGNFLSEDIARHVVELHNASLDRPTRVGRWVVGQGLVPVDGLGPIEEATR